jgi:hypothetical protein
MVKLIITLLNALVILALQVFQGNVSVKLDVPSEVQAGTEFEVKVTLNKGNLDGFSRFQQNIPAGLTATPVSSSNADFSFSDKKVRFIWLRIPQNDEITFSYRVKVDERLKGNFDLSGKFSYIENNERKSVDISSVAIHINPSPTVDPSLIVDINDYEKMMLPGTIAPEAVQVACIRQTPLPGTQGDFIVNILVSKNFTRQFAKIEETVPEGYNAVALDPKDAIFTFKEQKVKFLWMNLPQQPYFTVSYRLIPRNQAKLPAPQINGAFSYLVDEKTVSVNILESDVNVAEANETNVEQLIAMAMANPSKQNTVPSNETNPDVSVKNDTTPESELLATTNTTGDSKDEGKDKNTETSSKNVRARSTESISPSSDQGVYYRIQLAAGHKPVNVNRYFRGLKLDRKISTESHDGWKKYSVGSFNQYKEARDYRVHIWNTTSVKDAFITAYSSGERITVQEALMITSQKWVQ